MLISTAQRECHRIAKDHGWWEEWDRNIPEQLMLMTSELAEALEEYRKGYTPDLIYFGATGKPEGFGVELADTVIRIMDTCERYGINLEKVMLLKMEYNESRPYRHGGKNA